MSSSPGDYRGDEPGRGPDETKVRRSTIRKFREQIHALGAFWIIMGLLAGALAALALGGNKDVSDRVAGEYEVLVIILAVSGALWFVLGVATCFKQMWAVYTALVLSYLSLISNAINVNVCGLVILVIVILQAHRVIAWAGEMRAAGVPLNARPE